MYIIARNIGNILCELKNLKLWPWHRLQLGKRSWSSEKPDCVESGMTFTDLSV